MVLRSILPPHIFEAIDRVGLSTTKQVMVLSVWDIKKLTNLKADDILLLKSAVSQLICPKYFTGHVLKTTFNNNSNTRISVGCSVIDSLLNGGLRRGIVTELYGESGSGKTQVALQTALCNWLDGCVYICTEDLFPTKRFEEMKMNLAGYDSMVDYGKNIFVEHITEKKDLLHCTKVRLPTLLSHYKIAAIIIDSVAAPFRCDNINYVKRAEELRDLAISLLSIAQDYNLAVLCVNQVTASFDDTSDILPALGLAWSNMVTTRLMLRKTIRIADVQVPKASKEGFSYNFYIRELCMVFSPDSPNDVVELIITQKGIHGIGF